MVVVGGDMQGAGAVCLMTRVHVSLFGDQEPGYFDIAVERGQMERRSEVPGRVDVGAGDEQGFDGVRFPGDDRIVQLVCLSGILQ